MIQKLLKDFFNSYASWFARLVSIVTCIGILHIYKARFETFDVLWGIDYYSLLIITIVCTIGLDAYTSLDVARGTKKFGPEAVILVLLYVGGLGTALFIGGAAFLTFVIGIIGVIKLQDINGLTQFLWSPSGLFALSIYLYYLVAIHRNFTHISRSFIDDNGSEAES